MIEEIDFETYLYISKNKFQIFVFDKIEKKNLFKEEQLLIEQFNFEDFISLSKFLDENIYKIEKVIGSFIKNIFLIIDTDQSLLVNIAIKKKNYDNFFNQKYLESCLTEIKDIFRENYQNEVIMHMIVKNYILDKIEFSSLTTDYQGDNLCLDVNFISISKNFSIIFDKLLKKYQIKISRYICGNYINEYFGDSKNELSEKVNQLIGGINENEIILVPKNIENKGFFEKFFQLFS
tara:strand:+ start:1287 stop:1991 length:705 start_codon:yes stop_codon:yes gene_type:complete